MLVRLSQSYCSERVPSFKTMATPPITVTRNGELWTPADWDRVTIADGDQIEIVVEPKDPVTLVYVVIAAVVAAVAVAASVSVPDNYASTSPEGSPIYDANAQGNQVRLMGCVPEIFGRMGTYPCLINAPHRYYFDDEEYLLLMTMVSRGHVQLEQKKYPDR